MSYNVFPQLSGITWNIKKRPTWNTTKMLTAGGNEFRTGYRINPLTEFDLSYSYLSPTDKLSMEGFFNGQNGALTPFYFDLGVATNAASDNSVNAFVFGIGDGATTAFTLIKPAGTGAVEPIGGVNGAPSIYKSDWQGNQLQYSTPRTNLGTYSQALSNWFASNVTVTDNAAVAPDGTTTASKLLATAVGGTIVGGIGAVIAETNYSYSAYFKEGTSTASSMQIWTDDNAHNLGTLSFTWTAGVPGGFVPSSGASNVVSTAIGNGWYRISFEFNSGAYTSIESRISPDTNVGSNYLYAWGAQIEASQNPTSYIPTTTAPVTVTDYTLTGNQVAFAVAPLLNAILTWTGNFYYLVRFSEDVLEFNQLMNQMYELQECKLVSVR